MRLHRTADKSDWAVINARDFNLWQHLANSTKGIITPGNAVTLFGFAIGLSGLAAIIDHGYWLGGSLLALGRLCDIADGWLAELTKTKSPLGELLDATFDKIITFLTIGVLFYSKVAPPWLLATLLLPHIVITIVTLAAFLRRRRKHPSAIGKSSMAVLWVSLLGFVLIKAVNGSGFNILTLAVGILVLISVFSGFYALANYAFKKD